MAIIGDNLGGINPLRLPKSLPPGVPVEIQQLPTETVTLGGTGFAAPLVAGVAAAELQANPDLTTGDLTSVLKQERSFLPASVDGANLAGVKPTKASKINRDELGLHGLNSPRLEGLYSKGPLAELSGFGFKSFD